ncbi:LysR family transcriptional regulator [Kribbella solani]|uniref:DNA-binding transcriptional LysR family regulator n=1 Tax=Kribbella solani TaxID=236067 RepID=A0A841DY65_9ACTN|nr:LysR substrate-binding domain-containing protein [Kribbella solani]MBB5981710.1 DNA-binding transcriptional LysR family regulator [Kribbella solani]
MERQDIEVFLALAEELHFARTAERLRLTPAAVSQSLKRVERRLGAPLFTRTTRRVDLTPLGSQFLADLAPAYGQVQAAIARAVAAGHGLIGDLRLGYMSAAVTGPLLALVDSFRAQTPDVSVSIQETTLADLYGPLRRAEVDLCVLPLPVAEPDLTTGPTLLSEAAALAVPTGHRLAQLDSITAADLGDEPFLFAQNLPRYWIDHHLPAPAESVRTTSLAGFQEVLAYVVSGQGVAVVGAQTDRLYPRPGLTCVPLGDTAPFDYALTWRTETIPPLAKAFLTHAST